MINTAGGPSDYGQLVRLLDGANTVKAQLDVTNQQVATGRVAGSYAGLGAQARVSLDLRPQIAHAETWHRNIDTVSGRLTATQSALKGIQDIAAAYFAKTATLNGLSASDADTVAAGAKQDLERVAQLINTRVGDVYVFAGEDSAKPPLPDTSQAALTTALLASDTAQAPFSATLGTQPPTVEVGEGQRVTAGLLANRNTLAASAAPTTGSYLRDILRGLATLTTISNGPTLQATAADTRTRLSSALSTLGEEAGALGNVQRGLATRKDQAGETVTSLQAQVSSVEDVDLAAALTRATNLQTQLQASYQILAGLRNLTLSKYL